MKGCAGHRDKKSQHSTQSGSELEDGRIFSPERPASQSVRNFLFPDQSFVREIVKAYLKLAPVVSHCFSSFQCHLFSRDQSTLCEKITQGWKLMTLKPRTISPIWLRGLGSLSKLSRRRQWWCRRGRGYHFQPG